jgi:hypothetical protein
VRMQLNTIRRAIIVAAIVGLIVLALFPPYRNNSESLGHQFFTIPPDTYYKKARLDKMRWGVTGGIIVVAAFGLLWVFKDRE